MKKLVTLMVAAAMAFIATAEMARSEWHAKVGACAQNPALLQQTIAQLSAADQLAFLGEVNQAIATMPGSKDERAARFYMANKAAVSGAPRETRLAVLAEVFATVPVEVLTIINERFAKELFDRKMAPKVTTPLYMGLSTNVMATVTARLGTSENAGARATFALLMMSRAAGDTAAATAAANALVGMIGDASAQQEAKSSWIPQALGGEGGASSYDAILGAAAAGAAEPNAKTVDQIVQSSGAGTAAGGTTADGMAAGGAAAGGAAAGGAAANGATAGGAAAGGTGATAGGATAGGATAAGATAAGATAGGAGTAAGATAGGAAAGGAGTAAGGTGTAAGGVTAGGGTPAGAAGATAGGAGAAGGTEGGVTLASKSDFQGGIFTPGAAAPAGSAISGGLTTADVMANEGLNGGVTGAGSDPMVGGVGVNSPKDVINPDQKRGEVPAENPDEPKPYAGQ